MTGLSHMFGRAGILLLCMVFRGRLPGQQANEIGKGGMHLWISIEFPALACHAAVMGRADQGVHQLYNFVSAMR